PIYGGLVSAPVFAEVARYGLRLFKIPPPAVATTVAVPQLSASAAAADRDAGGGTLPPVTPKPGQPAPTAPSPPTAPSSPSAAFFGHPSRQLPVVGVTGTNGKTTTVHFLGSILEATGRRAGLIGTLTGERTTPEAPELQARLASFRDEGASAVAMEVSSHALALHRADAVWFSVAVFTNLSQDHLDFHHTMEEYFAAKARLFEPG